MRKWFSHNIDARGCCTLALSINPGCWATLRMFMQSPFFGQDRQDRAPSGTGDHLGFICTEGAGIGIGRETRKSFYNHSPPPSPATHTHRHSHPAKGGKFSKLRGRNFLLRSQQNLDPSDISLNSADKKVTLSINFHFSKGANHL